MTLSLTSRPAIRGRVIPRLPATMQAVGGLSVTKENGTWTFEPDWSQLPVASDTANQQVWVFNTVTEVYARMAVGTALDASKVAKTGDTMTGTLTINPATGSGRINIDNTQAAQQSVINFFQSSSVRWQFGKQTDDSFFLYDSVKTGYVFIAASNGNALVFGRQITAAATTTSYASLNLPTGSAPSAPVDGDIWRQDNTNTGLKIRVNGVTKTITLS